MARLNELTSEDDLMEIIVLATSNLFDTIQMRQQILVYLPCFKRYWNGAYYWHGQIFDFDSWKNALVLFDFTYEVFRYINMPEQCQWFCTWHYLVEMNGSLALFHFVEKDKSFEVWTMDEVEVNGTWQKLLHFGPLWKNAMPLLFIKSDELLMECGGQMMSYNLTTKRFKILPIYGEEGEFQAWTYKQSLVNFNSGSFWRNESWEIFK